MHDLYLEYLFISLPDRNMLSIFGKARRTVQAIEQFTIKRNWQNFGNYYFIDMTQGMNENEITDETNFFTYQ